MARQLGMRQVIGATFHTLWWVDARTPPSVLNAYFRALDRAEQAITATPAKYLPLWRHSNPPEFADYQWDYGAFSRGERFINRPISRAEFDEVMRQVERWGLDDFLQERSFDRLAFSPGGLAA